MIEWLILPAVVLTVVLAIVTAKPKSGAAQGEEPEGDRERESDEDRS